MCYNIQHITPMNELRVATICEDGVVLMNKADIFIWGMVLGVLVMSFCAKKLKRLKIQKMLKRAKTAEKKAIVFLEQAGYKVLQVQLRETVTILVDDKAHESVVKADLLVKKGFKKYIVEVKTGNQTSATLPNVRRQLLEYYLVYKPDGMLLLDMEKEKLKKIGFTYTQNAVDKYLGYTLVGLLGIVIGYLLVRVNS